VRAAFTLTGVLVSLRLLGARRTMKRAGRPPGSAPAGGSADPELEKRAVDRAAAAMRAGTCLSKALTLQTLLRRRGVESQLRFGIRQRDGSELLAHAWLETNGAPIGGGEGPDDSGLSVFPVPRATRAA